MTQKRTLILDEDDLIMVVKKDVVQQVDENRGEMNRSEFVNFLIQNQLKQYYSKQNYVDKEEFHQFSQAMKELIRNFLDFFLTYMLTIGQQPQEKRFAELNEQLQALDNLDGDVETS